MSTAKPKRRSRKRSMEALALDDGEQLISREVVARRLDCSAATVRKMVNSGRFIQPLLIGNLLRWRSRDVDLWIAERATTAKKIEAAAAKSLVPQTRSRRG
jgi:predicted DNA-binding transcriptional regulator AlpA